MIRNIGVAGVVAFLLIAALTLNQLVPSEFERGERASRKLTSPRDGGLDFRNLNKCALIRLGKVHGDDKFVSHTFGDLYCETMAPFRSSRAPLRMLEIGFGCGHHNHGKSALVWKTFFTEKNGPGVALYEVDFGPSAEHSACVDNFVSQHPGICDGIYLGDQSNKTFMSQVVTDTGGNYDIIIDDGGHAYGQQKATFEVLWSQLSPGGLYYIEDLQVSSSKDGMIRELLGWADQIANCRSEACVNMAHYIKYPITWITWPSSVPPDMISVHCQAEICVMKKSYAKPTTVQPRA